MNIEVIAISCGQEFPELLNAGREDCLCSEQDHPKLPLKEEGQSRGTESPGRGPVSMRRTDRLVTTFVFLVLMIQFLITLIYSQSLFVTIMFWN